MQLYSVHVELAPNNLRTEAAPELWFAPLERVWRSDIRTQSLARLLQGKGFFQISIEISMGATKMPTVRRILSHAFLPTAHVSCLFLTIDPKLRYCFSATPFSGLLSSYLGALQLLNVSLVVGYTGYERFTEAGST